MEGVDEVAFLAASELRAGMVAELFRDGPLDRDELLERSGATRVSVGRNLDRLQERGLVRATADRYRLSVAGEALVEEFLSTAETAATLAGLDPLLARLPPGEFDLDPRALADAELTVATRADPYAPVERHAETLAAASDVRVVLPAVGPRPVERSLDRLRDGSLRAELVVTPAVAGTLRSREYADDLAALLGGDALSILVHEGEVPFYLGLVDGTVQLGVDEEGVPRALAESDAEPVLAWAEATYEAYRSAARPLDSVDRGRDR